MTCSDVTSLIPLYLSGELEDDGAREFHRHVRNCANCAREISEHATLDSRLRADVLAEPVDSRAVEAHVRQFIAAETSSRATAWRWGFAGAGIAAVAVMGVFGYRAAFPHSVPASGTFAAAAEDHRMEIVEKQPRRWRTDLTSVSELAAREGISTSMISAIAPPDYHFQEGKLCRLDGRIYLHLVYSDSTGNRNYSVFLDGQSSSGGRRGVYSSNVGAEHVAGFESGPLKAMVVTDQSEEAARQFARFAASVI
jgi:anti-sigma factor RsiW